MNVPTIHPHARHAKQLQGGSPTASTDCGPRALIMTIQAGTHGDLLIPVDQQKVWVATLRREMNQHTGPTTLPQHERAAERDLVEGAYLGAAFRRAPSMLVATLPHDVVERRLEDGQSLNVLIDYGRLNDLMPSLSGSPTFRGLHFVCLTGYAKQGGVGWAALGDPLHDGRQPGIPKGWQTVRIRRYLRAAETAGSPPAGIGRAKVGVLLGGQPL